MGIHKHVNAWCTFVLGDGAPVAPSLYCHIFKPHRIQLPQSSPSPALGSTQTGSRGKLGHNRCPRQYTPCPAHFPACKALFCFFTVRCCSGPPVVRLAQSIGFWFVRASVYVASSWDSARWAKFAKQRILHGYQLGSPENSGCASHDFFFLQHFCLCDCHLPDPWVKLLPFHESCSRLSISFKSPRYITNKTKCMYGFSSTTKFFLTKHLPWLSCFLPARATMDLGWVSCLENQKLRWQISVKLQDDN